MPRGELEADPIGTSIHAVATKQIYDGNRVASSYQLCPTPLKSPANRRQAAVLGTCLELKPNRARFRAGAIKGSLLPSRASTPTYPATSRRTPSANPMSVIIAPCAEARHVDRKSRRQVGALATRPRQALALAGQGIGRRLSLIAGRPPLLHVSLAVGDVATVARDAHTPRCAARELEAVRRAARAPSKTPSQ